MGLRWQTAVLATAALLAVPACGLGDQGGSTPLAQGGPDPLQAQPFEPPARLCDALSGRAVAEATGHSPVTVDGAGTQCSWRTPAPGPEGTDVVLQGSFIDARSFDVGRPAGTGSSMPGLGDDAYVVHVDGEAPTTIYVRDGRRAFALWLHEPSADRVRAEGTLAELARQVLAS